MTSLLENQQSIDLAPSEPASPDWVSDAACHGMETEIFFAFDDVRGIKRARRLALARTVCASCPVAEQCLETALNTPRTYGIWGGTTPAERQMMKAAQRA